MLQGGGGEGLVGALQEGGTSSVHALDILLNTLDDDRPELTFLRLHTDVHVQLLHQVTNQGWGRGKGQVTWQQRVSAQMVT